MSLNNAEQLLAEAIRNMLDDAALGDKTHPDRVKKERANTFTFLHEEIEQEFRLKTIDLVHHEDVCSSFSKIHSYRYLDDDGFAYSFKTEMGSRAVPLEEQEKGLKTLEEVKKKFLGDSNEKDAGWNPDLGEIVDASQPPQIKESKEPADNYAPDREFFKNPKTRTWIANKPAFWESVNKTITPHIIALGYKCGNPKEFWEAYDDDAVELVIRDILHETVDKLQAEFRTIKES